MSEEIQFDFGLERHESANAAHTGCCVNKFVAKTGLHLLNRCSHLSHEVLRNLFKFGLCPIKHATFPFELTSCRVVLCIFFNSRGDPDHKHVFEFINSTHSVFVQHAECVCVALQNIISKNVQLVLLRFIFQCVDRLGYVRSENSTLSCLSLNLNNGRSEVLILLLSEQLFKSQIVDSKYGAHSRQQLALQLSKRARYVLAGSAVEKL